MFPKRVIVPKTPLDYGDGDVGIDCRLEGFGVGVEDVERRVLYKLPAVDGINLLAFLAKFLLPLFSGPDFFQPVFDGHIS